MKYKIITPNAIYNGVTEGVPFANGVGHTDNEATKNILVNDYGYKVEAEAAPKKAGKTSGK